MKEEIEHYNRNRIYYKVYLINGEFIEAPVDPIHPSETFNVDHQHDMHVGTLHALLQDPDGAISLEMTVRPGARSTVVIPTRKILYIEVEVS